MSIEEIMGSPEDSPDRAGIAIELRVAQRLEIRRRILRPDAR
jgi:hypothetical protein